MLQHKERGKKIMAVIDIIKEKAKADKKTIVLPESMDRRTWEAAEKILKEGLANLIIIGTPEDIGEHSKGLDVSGATIINPQTYEKTQEYIDLFVELRKAKGMTPEKAKETILGDYAYYGCLMIKNGDADGMVSGACHSTANTLRPCLQVIKTKPLRPHELIASAHELVPEKLGCVRQCMILKPALEFYDFL